MRLFLLSNSLLVSAQNYALSDTDLTKFVCRGNSWQLPQSCGADCTEADKTNYSCEVTMDVQGDNIRITSNGIPDHNLCSAPPNSAVLEGSYDFTVPRTPVKKSGDQSSFSATNMGAIGFAVNGVPIYNPYDRACCDAGLYELTALDLCYAHPNGAGGMYHYHVWSECLSACKGESELVGIALDGFPIYGPGINPDTGLVWSQSDMDVCGGKEVNGKYAYYTTVDFPYILQCYAGETSSTNNNGGNNSFDGNCGLWGSECDPTTGGGPPPRRTRRFASDPTTEWFEQLHSLKAVGHQSSYSKALVQHTENGLRKRRSVEALTDAIEQYIEDRGTPLPASLFLKHLSYTCNECNGDRSLSLNCDAEITNTCTNTKSLFTFNRPDEDGTLITEATTTTEAPTTTTEKTTTTTPPAECPDNLPNAGKICPPIECLFKANPGVINLEPFTNGVAYRSNAPMGCDDDHMTGNDGRNGFQAKCGCNSALNCRWTWSYGDKKRECIPKSECSGVDNITWNGFVGQKMFGTNGTHMSLRMFYADEDGSEMDPNELWTTFLMVPHQLVSPLEDLRAAVSTYEVDLVGYHVEADCSTTVFQFQSNDFHGPDFSNRKKRSFNRAKFHKFMLYLNNLDLWQINGEIDAVSVKAMFEESKYGWTSGHHGDVSECVAKHFSEKPGYPPANVLEYPAENSQCRNGYGYY